MSRKAGKAQQLSMCCSVSVPCAQRLGELAGMEERCHCCSQRSRRALGAKAMQPATPAQFSLSVPPLLNFKWTSFYSDVMVRGIENKRHG